MILLHIACQEGHIWLLFCYDTFYFTSIYVLFKSICYNLLISLEEHGRTKQYETLPPSNNDELRSPDPATLLFQNHPGPTAGLNRGLTLGFHPFHLIGSLEWHKITPGGGCGVPWKGLGHNWLVAEKGRIHETNPVSTHQVMVNSNGVIIYTFQNELTGIKKRPRPGYPRWIWPHEEWGPPAASIQQINSLFDGRTPPFFGSVMHT